MFSRFAVGILIIWLSHLCIDFMLGVWPVYKTLITLDLVLAGLIASIGMFIGEGLQLYFGVLSDKGFHQRLITLGVFLTITIPFLSYVENEWLLFICVLSAFIGSGAFHPAASSLLVGWSSSYKSLLIALFACGGMIGAALSQYVFVKVHTAFDGHTWMLSLPVLFIGLCCYFFPFSRSSQAKGLKVDVKSLMNILKLRRRELTLLYITQVCLQMIVLAFSFLLPDMLKARGYEEWFCLGGGYFYFIMGAALSSLPIGYGMDRWGYKALLGMVILGAIGLLTLFLEDNVLSVGEMAVLLMFMGGTMGVIVPIMVAGSTSLVPSHASGIVSAVYMGGASCLAGFGPMLASFIGTFFAAEAPVRALQLLSFLFIIPVSLFYFLPRHAQDVPDALVASEEVAS